MTIDIRNSTVEPEDFMPAPQVKQLLSALIKGTIAIKPCDEGGFWVYAAHHLSHRPAYFGTIPEACNAAYKLLERPPQPHEPTS